MFVVVMIFFFIVYSDVLFIFLCLRKYSDYIKEIIKRRIQKKRIEDTKIMIRKLGDIIKIDQLSQSYLIKETILSCNLINI